MNRIAISITMILPPLFLLSLFVAQPVSAAQPDGAAAVAAPWGSGAIAPPGGIRPYASEVVFGECTGSACSAPHPGGGLAPVPLQLAPLVVNVRPNALRVDSAPTPVFRAGTGMAPLPTDIVRGQSTGSASSLPRVVDDLLSRLLELVHRAPLQLPR
ncbi:hypothetical protein ACWEO2_05960 [Nocardia sp. NPDC004278]